MENSYAMKRPVKNRESILSNEELSTEHSGISSSNYTMVKGPFRWFSGDKFPIVAERVETLDHKTTLPVGFSMWLKIIFLGVLPLGLMFTGVTLIVRRQRK